MSFLAGSLLWQSLTGGNVLARVLANIGHDIEAFVAWLARDGWRVVSFALALTLAYQTVTKSAERRHSQKVEGQLIASENARKSLQAQLDAISSKRNVQRQVTRDRIVTVTKMIHDADGAAKKVENAPLPGNCKSPQSVLEADI